MEGITINITKTTMIKPSEETPRKRMWVSNLDLVMSRVHPPVIYFYKHNDVSSFFDPKLIKETLAKTLTLYYPVAGRLRKDAEGRRIEIDCNDEGALFVEAESTLVLDDFGDFSPTTEYTNLAPVGNYSVDISSYPLLLAQLTYFNCGGVSLGVAIHHLITDALSVIRFINTWAYMTQELDHPTLPWLDRTLLRAGDPPSPMFDHVEYQKPLKLSTPRQTSVTYTTKRAFNITRGQINALKDNCNRGGKDYTSFEALSGHIWRCVSKARGLPDEQPVKLYVPIDARSRLEPNFPTLYFGNAIFMACSMAMAGELISNPASYAAHKIRDSIVRMDNEYLRSALDYIELHLDNDVLVRGSNTFACPNLCISSWAKLPIYAADFGWGRPTYMGPGGTKREGGCNLLQSAIEDGGISVIITLEDEHMQLFESYFYDI